MEWLENLNANGKAVYFLSLTELLINKLSDANYYDIVKKSIDLGWQWVFQKDVAADDLYYYLENLSENDILSYLQMESDSEKEAVLICVAEALSYVIYEAYTYENAKYMPETIEAVDGTTTDEFVYAFKSVCRISGIMDDMKDFCIMNFPKNENKNVNKEFIDSYIRDKVSRYDDQVKDGKKKEIIVLVSLGEVLSSYLPDNEGKIFSKRVLDYCWNYIAEDKIDLEYLYDSIDSPDEIDFAYYECVAEPLENKKIFRYLFDVVAYVTKKISIEENISMPQYLDYIHNDFYQDLLGRISNDYPKLKELDNEIGSVYELKSAKLTKVDFESVFSKYM